MNSKKANVDTNEFLIRIGEEMKALGAETLTFPTVFVKDPNSNLGFSFNRIAENVYQFTLSDNNNILIAEYFYWGLDKAVEVFIEKVKSTIESTMKCKNCEHCEFQA